MFTLYSYYIISSHRSSIYFISISPTSSHIYISIYIYVSQRPALFIIIMTEYMVSLSSYDSHAIPLLRIFCARLHCYYMYNKHSIVLDLGFFFKSCSVVFYFINNSIVFSFCLYNVMLVCIPYSVIPRSLLRKKK